MTIKWFVPALSFFILLSMYFFPFIAISQDIGGETIVQGNVVNQSTGEPLKDALVRLWGNKESLGFITEEDGHFIFYLNVIVEENIQMVCQKQGYYDEWKEFTIKNGDNYVTDFNLTPKQSSISGYITDRDTNEPIGEAFVQLFSDSSNSNGDWVYSDENGYYNAFAEPGSYQIIVSADNYYRYYSEGFELSENERLQMNFSLQLIPSGIFGSVFDQDGNPLDNAVVNLFSDNNSFNTFRITNSDGEYQINAPPGHYSISVSCDGYITYQDTVTIEKEEYKQVDIEMVEISIRGLSKYIIAIILEIFNGLI